MADNVRTRFAPSPTGYLHVGAGRTALFNYLFARHHGGTFILRIEDTDRSRFVEDALNEIYESLRWLGLQWDEGPGVGGAYGPYIQSERLEIYQKYAKQLLESGHAYRCFCTPERLAQLRLQQEKEKARTGYDRHCRELPSEEIERKLEQGLPYVIRFKIPLGRKVVFDDQIRGTIEYKSDVLDDLVLLKTDTFPTYHMANVVDDHLMKITHVLRGEEWIASTPRHVLLYEAFGWEPPKFAHLPVILAPDGGKLSKRKGAASVMDYKREGILPEALFNFLALIGWAPGDDREKMSLPELIESFSLDQVSPKASVFDEKKLEWMNGLYLAERSTESVLNEVLPVWKEKGWCTDEQDSISYCTTVVELMKSRSKRLTDLAENVAYFFEDPVEYEPKAVKKHIKAGTEEILIHLVKKLGKTGNFDHATLETVYRDYAEESGVSIGKLIHPTRLAVSGVSFGPGLYELLAALGKETVLRRMEKAIPFVRELQKEN